MDNTPNSSATSYSLLQWNIEGVRPKYLELQSLARDYRLDFIALQETFLNPSVNLKLKGFSTFSVPGLGGRGGVALLVNNRFSFSEITLPPLDLQVVAVRVCLPDFSICLANIYDPLGTLDTAVLTTLQNFLGTSFIITGDFNAHHPLWGDGKIDSQGRNLVDWCAADARQMLTVYC